MTATRWINVGAAVGSGCGGGGGRSSVRCDFGGVTPFVTEAEHCVFVWLMLLVFLLCGNLLEQAISAASSASFRHRNRKEIEKSESFRQNCWKKYYESSRGSIG